MMYGHHSVTSLYVYDYYITHRDPMSFVMLKLSETYVKSAIIG